VAGTCECGNEHSSFLTSCEPVSFSRRSLLHGVSKYVSNYGDQLSMMAAAS
jgi:hypothetical protein